MTQTDSWPKRTRELGGLRVRTLKSITNGYMTIPAGVAGVITSASGWRRIHFRADACPHCGVIMRMSGVNVGDLERMP